MKSPKKKSQQALIDALTKYTTKTKAGRRNTIASAIRDFNISNNVSEDV